MTFSTQIIDVINFLCQKFGVAIDWTSENVMPYLHELATRFISWEVATSKMWLWIGVLLCVLGIAGIVLEAFTHCWGGMMTFVGIIMLCVGFVVVGVQIYDILTCIHLPEKQIFEYVQTWTSQSR